MHAIAQRTDLGGGYLSMPRALLGSAVGATLVVGGLGVAWIAIATPFVAIITPAAQGMASVVLGLVAWSAALMAPAAFLLAGVLRLAAVIQALARPRLRPPVSAVAAEISDECVVISSVRLPDSREIPEVVVGPFGVAVVEEIPPRHVLRRNGNQWELRGPGDRWVPHENPLERAERDANALRSWLEDGDWDFVVRVYAGVVADDPSLARSAACAVINRAQIPAWLAALPAQRTLTRARRDQIAALLQSRSRRSAGVPRRRGR